MGNQSIDKLDKNLKVESIDDVSRFEWLTAADPRVELRGLPWFIENGSHCFSRLPLRAESIVRPAVWNLAQSPASACLAFRTDSTRLAVKVRNSDCGTMGHMPMSGSNGLILYAGAPGRMAPWATAMADPSNPSFERPLVAELSRQMREYRLYLPLYKHLVELELGVAPGSTFEPATAPALAKPVAIYGTSITQGGCANTAGTDFVSILGRMLNLHMINLGFSGNGWGEPELAMLMREVDASLYVLDYAANVDTKRLADTLPEFVRLLRETRPEVPILLVTNICYGRYDHSAAIRAGIEAKRDAMMAYYVAQRALGDNLIHLADGFHLIPFGADGVTVDGVHPTDHGFMRMAEGLAPVLSRILLRDA